MQSPEMPDSQDPRNDDGLLKWFSRFVLVGAASFLLFKPTWTAHLANWFTLVSIVGGFYIATFEPKVLAWLIERVSKFLALRKLGKAKLRWPRFSFPGIPIASSKTRPTSYKTGDESVSGSVVPVWIVMGTILAALLLIPLTGRVGPHKKEEPTYPMIAKKQLPTETLTEPVEIMQTPSRKSYRVHKISPNDRCYTIAIACTGDGERFVELGPPVNPNLDVSNREFCLIEVGEQLNIPNDWPKDCLL